MTQTERAHIYTSLKKDINLTASNHAFLCMPLNPNYATLHVESHPTATNISAWEKLMASFKQQRSNNQTKRKRKMQKVTCDQFISGGNANSSQH